jgi:hypothetical protein
LLLNYISPIGWLKTLCRWCPKPELFVKDLCFLQSPKPTFRYTDWFWRFQLLLSLKADFWGKHTWSQDWPHNVKWQEYLHTQFTTLVANFNVQGGGQC